MLQRFLASLDAPITSREEGESYDLPVLMALDASDRAVARDAMIARLAGGSTDSRLIGALTALRDAAVTPALRAALDSARSRPPTGFLFALLDVLGDDPTAPCVAVLTSGDLDLADTAATRLVAHDPDRAREVLPTALRASILQTSREHLLDAMIRACGLADADYRVPSRLSSLFARASGWPSVLSADVADHALRLAADVEGGRGAEWTRPLPRTAAFDAALAAIAADGRAPALGDLDAGQLEYLASVVLGGLPHANRAGLDVLVGADDPAALPALRQCVAITWLDEASLAPLLAAVARIEARHR